MSHFRYLEPRPQQIIVTPMIEHAAARILISHETRGQFAVVAGRSGGGKSTAAEYMAGAFTADYENGVPNAFRAKRYVSTEMRTVREDVLERHLLAELVTKGLELRIARDIRQYRAADLQRIALTAARDRGIQMLFIDEAGLIPVLGLNMLANLLNEANLAYGWPLTIVLVGMNDLPVNVGELPQVARRVAATIWFEPVGATEAITVLRHVHPYFETLDPTSLEGEEVLQFLLAPETTDGGLLGKMIQLVERAAKHAKVSNQPFSLHVMRTALELERLDAARSQLDARRGYKGKHPDLTLLDDAPGLEAEAASLTRPKVPMNPRNRTASSSRRAATR